MSDTILAYSRSDPHRLRSMTGIVEHAGPASKRIVTGYGFWIFILSDMVMFSAFFATYAVLLGQTAGGPSGRDLFDLRYIAIEMRPRQHCSGQPQRVLVSGCDGRHLRLGPWLSCH